MMIRAIVGAVALFGFTAPTAATAAVIRSPDGRIQIEVVFAPSAGKIEVPQYTVSFDGRVVVGPSLLGLLLADGTALGGPCTIEGVETKSLRESFRQVTGKRSEVVANCQETVVRFREKAASGRTWELVVRAYDDAAAFRYRFPVQPGWNQLEIAGERTEFNISTAARVVAMPLNSFTTSHEKLYRNLPVAELPKDWLLGVPLLAEYPGGVFAAITEANVTDYAGMYLAPLGGGKFISRLSPMPNSPKIAVRAPLPHASPWRVVLVGDRIGRLVESDVILALNEPCAIKDTSWIKPGKTTFPWWNGYFEENVPFKPGLNTATMKHYIDFCAEAGIPYHSLDGTGNTAWYGGPIVPYQGADSTKAIDTIDMPEVLKYAKSKGVRLRLWMNWKAAEAHMDRAFPLYKQWGIEGVMLDFMDRDDQEMLSFLRRAVKTAADNHLTMTLHGCAQPTGLERTYPNLLSSEGVLNLEYDKWDKIGCPPDHEMTVPFTRMLAGPLDFHQGSFRTVRPDAFKPRDVAPQIMGTPCRTLASYVVYQNHMAMVVDYPSAYRGHPGLPILAKIPTTWDETRVLDAKVGQYVAIARRSGTAWYVAAMTDRAARELPIPLTFLPKGSYAAEVFIDDDGTKHGMALRLDRVTSATLVPARMSAAGGWLMRIETGSR